MEENMEKKEYYSAALAEFLKIAETISHDVAKEVEVMFEKGFKSPLSKKEARNLFAKIVSTIKAHAAQRGDKKTVKAIGENLDILLTRILDNRVPIASSNISQQHIVHLLENYNGIKPSYVVPRPWFHETEIPMLSGYVKTTDIQLWDGNVRLDIHVGQFKEKYGRNPTPQELLDIMTSRMQLPGVSEGDQFHIAALARSIAINGVRKPPIIDIDGTLLDGNRRLAACHYILNNDEFSSEEKKRAKYIFVWQLTPDATDDNRRRVVVSLNFEPDFKEDWPEYVKARKVYEDWQAILALEPIKPGPRRQTEMRKELSQKYALGPEPTVVTRYIKMVEWADDFEDYHIEERKKDKFAVKHKSSEYFQYFEELGKGTRPGGVAYGLNQDENFKKIAFDLLFDDKFKNWTQIRKLKKIFENEEARERLRRARDEQDVDQAQDLVEDAISIADTKSAEKRSLGANTRIEIFVKWLEELPVKAFRDDIKPENLERLLEALMLVKSYVEEILGKKVAV
jgi:hypothetical protein